MPTNINEQPKVKRGGLTGRMVLLIFVGFFLVFATANSVMVFFASKTFRGLDGERPYEAGLEYNREIAAAREQDKLGWKVEARMDGDASAARIAVQPRDGADKPLSGLVAKVRLGHPTDRSRDLNVALLEGPVGVYAAAVAPTSGAWDVNLELQRDGKTVYRSKNRIDVK